MALVDIKWNNTAKVLEEEGPVLVERYKEFANTSFDVTFEVDGLQLRLNLPPYAQYIEEGRRPGKFPPPDAISKWITVKNILPRAEGGIQPTTRQLTYLIGRKIAEQGTVGKKALEKTWAEVVPEFKARLRAAMMADIKAEVRSWFGKGSYSGETMHGV